MIVLKYQPIQSIDPRDKLSKREKFVCKTSWLPTVLIIPRPGSIKQKVLNSHFLDTGNDLTVIGTNLITLDPRLPFPDPVGGIFPGPATTQKVYQGIELFSQLAGLQLTVLSMLIRG